MTLAFYTILTEKSLKKCIYIIQASDLCIRILYTATGVVTLELSGFAMFNAPWIMLLLYLFSKEGKTN